MAFIFGGNTPWTYEQLQSKRRIAEELMAANMGTPRNVGEGLTAIGRALAIRGINKKADKRDAELKGEYDTARGAVLSALMGGAPGAAPSMAAPGVTAPVDPNSPQGVANDTMKALGKAPDFSALEAQYGLPAGYLERTAMIESGGNPNAQNPNSSAGGMFQFIDSTAKQYGLTDKTDPLASADAAARLAADNRAYLAKALGREPTAGELYLAHQQGAGGAARLLAAGNAPAASVVGGDAVGLNGGNAGMTAADFAGKWTGKFGETVQPANADIGTIADLLANPYATPGDKAILGALLQQRMDAADPMKRIEMERAQLELEALRNPQANVPDAVRSRVMLAEQAGLTPDMPEYQTYILTGELPKPADPMKRIEMERAQLELEALRNPQAKDTRTDDIREYEFARSQGYDGTFQQFMTDMKKAGAATQTVNVGDGAPGLGKLSTDYGYILDPVTRQPKIDPETGLPMAAPVPGSPAAMEVVKGQNKAAAANSNAMVASDIVTTAADRALKAAKNRNFGATGTSIVGMLPWTDSAEVMDQVDVLKAQASIENLTAMREASPTGGALGSVTPDELKILQDKSGRLNPNSPNFERDLAGYTRQLLRTIHGDQAGDEIFRQTWKGQIDQPAQAQPAQKTTGPAQISDEAGYEALPSGAEFIGPDGKLRRKP